MHGTLHVHVWHKGQLCVCVPILDLQHVWVTWVCMFKYLFESWRLEKLLLQPLTKHTLKRTLRDPLCMCVRVCRVSIYTHSLALAHTNGCMQAYSHASERQTVMTYMPSGSSSSQTAHCDTFGCLYTHTHTHTTHTHFLWLFLFLLSQLPLLRFPSALCVFLFLSCSLTHTYTLTPLCELVILLSIRFSLSPCPKLFEYTSASRSPSPLSVSLSLTHTHMHAQPFVLFLSVCFTLTLSSLPVSLFLPVLTYVNSLSVSLSIWPRAWTSDKAYH